METSGGDNEGHEKQVSLEKYDDLPERGTVDTTAYSDFDNIDELEEDPAYKFPDENEETRSSRPGGTPYSTALRVERYARQMEKELKQDEASKTVHILGYDPRAYLFAHQLASYGFLNPPKVLIHNSIVWNNWLHEGKQVALFVGGQRSVRKRVEAEWVGSGRQPRATGHIKQLIVTMTCVKARKALENIAFRIDERTTICLVQDGHGLVEELNETLFTDPARRPTYILGVSSATIWYHKPVFFASVLESPGKLYLTSLERGLRSPFGNTQPQGRQFLRTLVGTHGLGAGAYGMENFLLQKFPMMVFNSIIEPMAVALDTTYNNILTNKHAILLADDLLRELFNVIWALPELNNSIKLSKYCGMDALRKYTLKRLTMKGSARSDMVSQVRAGKMPDIDYFNGYFLKRGVELGIKMPQNQMMIEVVKARVKDRAKMMDAFVPFEGVGEPRPR